MNTWNEELSHLTSDLSIPRETSFPSKNYQYRPKFQRTPTRTEAYIPDFWPQRHILELRPLTSPNVDPNYRCAAMRYFATRALTGARLSSSATCNVIDRLVRYFRVVHTNTRRYPQRRSFRDLYFNSAYRGARSFVWMTSPGRPGKACKQAEIDRRRSLLGDSRDWSSACSFAVEMTFIPWKEKTLESTCVLCINVAVTSSNSDISSDSDL